MFERFTDRARRAVVLAQEESRALGHDWIGTEHLLLGLAGIPESVAGRALGTLRVDLDEVRRRVSEIIGPGKRVPTGHVPFTPRAKRILEMSLRESIDGRASSIGTGHILVALVREGEGVGAQVLRALDVDLSAAQQAVEAARKLGAAPKPERQIELHAMSEEEFAAFRAWQEEHYAEESALGHAITLLEARVQTRAELETLLSEGIATPGHRFLVAEDAETHERIGHLWFATRHVEAGEVLWLYDVNVEETFRGKGFGRQMMLWLEDEARRMGIRRIELNVFGYNVRARRLYGSLGYVEMARQMFKELV